MTKLRTWATVVVTLSVLGSARASPPRERLSAVSNNLVRALGMVVTYAAVNPPKGEDRVMMVAVKPDGEFYERQFIENGAHTANWKGTPAHYVNYTGGVLYVSTPGGGPEYTQQPLRGYADNPPGPVQWELCPWPVAGRLCRWLSESADVRLADSAGGLMAASATLALSIEFDDHDRLVAITRGNPDREDSICFRYEYSGTATTPTGMSQTVLPAPGKGQAARTVWWRVKSVRELAEEPGAIVFDPVKLDVSRYDPVTGDVIHPVRGKLYNRNDVERLAAAATWQHRYGAWIIGGLVGLIVGSAICGYRRISKA